MIDSQSNDTIIKKNNWSKKRRNELLFYIAFMALPIIQVIIFYFLVNFNSVMLAFKEYQYASDGVVAGYKVIGLDNFVKCFKMLFTEMSLVYSLKNSIVAMIVQIFISTPLALLFSFYIFQKKFGSTVFRIFLFLPAVISPLVIAILFKVMLEQALPAYILKIFGKKVAPIYGTHTMASLLFYSVWTSFGTNVLMYTSAMSGVDDSILEAAKLDGAKGWQEFLYVVFPMIYPTVTTFVVVSIATLFTNQLNLFSFENSQAEKKFWTYGYYLFVKVESGTIADYPHLSALGLIFTVIAVPLTMFTRWIMTKLGPSME